jgi:photosystem II stability/assembly factor-like uncharacterized protein
MATRDGGRSWTRQVSGQRVKTLEAIDVRHAWALTADSLLATSNGGRSWTSHRLPQGLAAVDFIDAHVGWALALEGELLATRDGGATWRSLNEPVHLDSMCVSSATRGLAARGRIVYATHDTGRTWKVAHRARFLGTSASQAPLLQCRGSAAWLLLRGGFAAGSQGYAAYSTRDGIHWRLVLGQFLQRRVPRLDAYAGPFSVVNASTAFFVGFCPACGAGKSLVARTHDGGLHWRRSRRQLAGYWPLALSFAGRRTGFLLTGEARAGPGGPGGVVWKTADGGRTWHRVLRSAAL